MVAAEKGLLEVVEVISQFGADLDFQEKNKGLTALMCAAIKNKHDICDYLIKYGANPALKVFMLIINNIVLILRFPN
jgi:ankyrin repeat protein